MADTTAYDFTLTGIDGKPMPLSQFKGHPVLVVNTASECGYTPQYEELEALWNAYKDKGLVVLGVPSNDFGGQEPGSAAEIKTFCSSTYNVTFPLMEKVTITADTPHPLYKELMAKAGEVGWNFTKFLVSKDGAVVTKFEADVEPQGSALETAIVAALK